MNGTEYTDRRTVLKAITATAIGGSVVTGATNAAAARPPGKAGGRRDIVEIVARHDHEAEGTGEHTFDLSTSETPAGWTTLEFDNRSEHTHFVYTSRIPQQAIKDAKAEEMDLLDFWIETVTNPFQYFMDTLVDGKKPDSDDLSDIYETLFPPWFGDVTFYGGPGLTSGHRSSTSTVKLDPGEYIVECYVKDSDNDFHSYRGMIDLLTVTDEPSPTREPESTLDLSLSNNGLGFANEVRPGGSAGGRTYRGGPTDGIDVADEVRPGQHIVGVEFEEQQAYSNLVGHDVHLIRLDDDTTVDDVNSWMNWADPTQFISEGDEPETFLGGVSDIWTAGLPETGYFHVTLEPGDYAWVAEVPDPASKGLLQEFTVPFGRATGGR